MEIEVNRTKENSINQYRAMIVTNGDKGYSNIKYKQRRLIGNI